MHNNSSFLWRRIAAFLYDSFLLIALFFAVTAIAVAINNGSAIQNHLFKGVLLLVAYSFFSWFWRNGGQTLGMQAWRIQLINESTENITHMQCLKRFFCGLFLFGIVLVTALFNQQGKGLHDKFSKTFITYKSKS